MVFRFFKGSFSNATKDSSNNNTQMSRTVCKTHCEGNNARKCSSDVKLNIKNCHSVSVENLEVLKRPICLLEREAGGGEGVQASSPRTFLERSLVSLDSNGDVPERMMFQESALLGRCDFPATKNRCVEYVRSKSFEIGERNTALTTDGQSYEVQPQPSCLGRKDNTAQRTADSPEDPVRFTDDKFTRRASNDYLETFEMKETRFEEQSTELQIADSLLFRKEGSESPAAVGQEFDDILRKKEQKKRGVLQEKERVLNEDSLLANLPMLANCSIGKSPKNCLSVLAKQSAVPIRCDATAAEIQKCDNQPNVVEEMPITPELFHSEADSCRHHERNISIFEDKIEKSIFPHRNALLRKQSSAAASANALDYCSAKRENGDAVVEIPDDAVTDSFMRSYLDGCEFCDGADGDRRPGLCTVRQTQESFKSKSVETDTLKRESQTSELALSSAKQRSGITKTPTETAVQKKTNDIDDIDCQIHMSIPKAAHFKPDSNVYVFRPKAEELLSNEALCGCKNRDSSTKTDTGPKTGGMVTDGILSSEITSSFTQADEDCGSAVSFQTQQPAEAGTAVSLNYCSGDGAAKLKGAEVLVSDINETQEEIAEHLYRQHKALLNRWQRKSEWRFLHRDNPTSSAFSENFDLDALDDFLEFTDMKAEKFPDGSNSVVPRSAQETAVSEASSAVPHLETSKGSNEDYGWGMSIMDVLSEEIWDCHTNLTQSGTVFNRKLHLRDCLYHTIHPVFPTCGLYIVGSSLNGFGANSSDMDLCLMITSRELDQRSEAFMVLSKIRSRLEEKSWVLEQVLIPAKVPILRIKFSEPFEDITVDLNANNAVAIRNTHLLSYYSSFDWRVRPLVSIVKEWAKRRDINDANRSSFTSYSLVLMVIHYLQCGVNPPVLPSLQELYKDRFNGSADIRLLDISRRLERPLPEEWQRNALSTLGELLIGFLEYYAFKFDYLHDAISVRLGKKVGRAYVARQRSPLGTNQKVNIAQWNCICIEEPFTLTNTAHSVHSQLIFDAIRQAFVDGYKELVMNCDLKSFLSAPPICYPHRTSRRSSSPVSALTYAQIVASPPKNKSRGETFSHKRHSERRESVNVASRCKRSDVVNNESEVIAAGPHISLNSGTLSNDQLASEGIHASCIFDVTSSGYLLHPEEIRRSSDQMVLTSQGANEISSRILDEGAVAGVKESAEDVTSETEQLSLKPDDPLSRVDVLSDSKQMEISKLGTLPLPLPKPGASLSSERESRIEAAGVRQLASCPRRARRKKRKTPPGLHMMRGRFPNRESDRC